MALKPLHLQLLLKVATWGLTPDVFWCVSTCDKGFVVPYFSLFKSRFWHSVVTRFTFLISFTSDSFLYSFGRCRFSMYRVYNHRFPRDLVNRIHHICETLLKYWIFSSSSLGSQTRHKSSADTPARVPLCYRLCSSCPFEAPSRNSWNEPSRFTKCGQFSNLIREPHI